MLSVSRKSVTGAVALGLSLALAAGCEKSPEPSGQHPEAHEAIDVSQETLASITTPDQVETSIGTLDFLDGAPYPETS